MKGDRIPILVLRYIPGMTEADAKVMLCICAHMNSQMTAYPGVKTIAAETGLVERTIRKALRRMSAKGWIGVSAGNDRGKRTIIELLTKEEPAFHVCANEKGNGEALKAESGAPKRGTHSAAHKEERIERRQAAAPPSLSESTLATPPTPPRTQGQAPVTFWIAWERFKLQTMGESGKTHVGKIGGILKDLEKLHGRARLLAMINRWWSAERQTYNANYFSTAVKSGDRSVMPPVQTAAEAQQNQEYLKALAAERHRREIKQTEFSVKTGEKA